MSTYDFSHVDFSRPEVRASLARAYVVLLRIPKPLPQEHEPEAGDTGKEIHTELKSEETATRQEAVYVQKRLF